MKVLKHKNYLNNTSFSLTKLIVKKMMTTSQKMVSATRQLAHGTLADTIVEYKRVPRSLGIEILKISVRILSNSSRSST